MIRISAIRKSISNIGDISRPEAKISPPVVRSLPGASVERKIAAAIFRRAVDFRTVR
jgi:hypothetical protein